MACTATASWSVRNALEMAGCVQVTTSDLRPTVRLGLSSDTILDGLPIVAPINVVTALIDRLVLLFLLLVKSVLATFERGLSQSVLGDTPTLPVIAFVLLRQLTDLLKEARSLPAFSRDLILMIHLEQTSDD